MMKWFVFYTSPHSWGMEQFDTKVDAEMFMDKYTTEHEKVRFKVILGSFEDVAQEGGAMSPDWKIK